MNSNNMYLDKQENMALPLSFPIATQGEQEMKAKKRRKRKKRGDGEAKRNMLSEEQTRFLELCFGRERRLGAERKERLALEAGIDPKRVAVWFQNRRARWKGKMMEEEYAKLKAAHDSTMVLKCQLETEVLKLREELSEAHREIEKLSSSDEMRSVENGGGGDEVLAQMQLGHLQYEWDCINDSFSYVNMWEWGF